MFRLFWVSWRAFVEIHHCFPPLSDRGDYFVEIRIVYRGPFLLLPSCGLFRRDSSLFCFVFCWFFGGLCFLSQILVLLCFLSSLLFCCLHFVMCLLLFCFCWTEIVFYFFVCLLSSHDPLGLPSISLWGQTLLRICSIWGSWNLGSLSLLAFTSRRRDLCSDT